MTAVDFNAVQYMPTETFQSPPCPKRLKANHVSENAMPSNFLFPTVLGDIILDFLLPTEKEFEEALEKASSLREERGPIIKLVNEYDAIQGFNDFSSASHQIETIKSRFKPLQEKILAIIQSTYKFEAGSFLAFKHYEKSSYPKEPPFPFMLLTPTVYLDDEFQLTYLFNKMEGKLANISKLEQSEKDKIKKTYIDGLISALFCKTTRNLNFLIQHRTITIIDMKPEDYSKVLFHLAGSAGLSLAIVHITACVVELIAAKADVNYVKDNKSVLQIAIMPSMPTCNKEHLHLVKILLENGARNASLKCAPLQFPDFDPYPPRPYKYTNKVANLVSQYEPLPKDCPWPKEAQVSKSLTI